MGPSDDVSVEISDPAERAPLAYRFAGFRLSAQHQRLERIAGGEQPTALTTKLYHLLLTFAARPREVISKESIVQAVWPGQVVTDAALAKQMQRLRKLLSTGPDDPPLIETHWGRGYRFICDVQPEYALTDSASADKAPTPGETRDTRNPVRRVSALALVVAVAGLVIAVTLNQEREAPASPGTIALLPVSDPDNALSDGAAEYLAARLGPGAQLTPVMTAQASPERAAELGSLELFERRGRPVAAVHLARDEARYRLQIDLRGEDLVSQATMRDESIQRLLERAAAWMHEQTGIERRSTGNSSEFALASYFQALIATDCDASVPFLRAAVSSDPQLLEARLRLVNCELAQGRTVDAVAGAETLLALAAGDANTGIALRARLAAARALRTLGRVDESEAHLSEAVAQLASGDVAPLQRLPALAAIAMLADMEAAPTKALAARLERLELATAEYPVPAFLAAIHLEIAEGGLVSGDYDLMRVHAEEARAIVEENGDRDGLIRSYRFLITSYFRGNKLDAAAQLALAARPLLAEINGSPDAAVFMQFAGIALNATGHLDEGRAYTAQLRQLETSTANPMFGVFADTTLFHRLFARGAFEEAYTFAASLRARLEARDGQHSALPQAIAFEALGASRGAPLEVARAVIERLDRGLPGNAALKASRQRAMGHILLREGEFAEGLVALRKAEAHHRDNGVESVADYVGYEIAEARLRYDQQTPWDDLRRLLRDQPSNYFLARLVALAHARDGDLAAAAAELEKARLVGNQLWSSEDQLLLERYRNTLAKADRPP